MAILWPRGTRCAALIPLAISPGLMASIATMMLSASVSLRARVIVPSMFPQWLRLVALLRNIN